MMKKVRRLFSVCSPENKYFDGGLAGRVFWGFLACWGVYWLEVGDTPLLRGLLESRFWRDFSGKVLKENGLEAKY
ncbi:MAG: hypothetical protein ACLPLR_02920 [Terriglobales bacterium]